MSPYFIGGRIRSTCKFSVWNFSVARKWWTRTRVWLHSIVFFHLSNMTDGKQYSWSNLCTPQLKHQCSCEDTAPSRVPTDVLDCHGVLGDHTQRGIISPGNRQTQGLPWLLSETQGLPWLLCKTQGLPWLLCGLPTYIQLFTDIVSSHTDIYS